MLNVMNIVDNHLGMAALACAIVIIMKPKSINLQEDVKKRNHEIALELLFAFIGKAIPFLGLLIGLYGIMGKSMEFDEFLAEEKERNIRIAFVIGLAAEIVSVIIAFLS